MSSNAVFAKASPLDVLQRWLPKLVLAPSMVIVLVGFYGYIGWTFLLSFTNSRFMPSYNFVGLQQYARLWDNDRIAAQGKTTSAAGASPLATPLRLRFLPLAEAESIHAMLAHGIAQRPLRW